MYGVRVMLVRAREACAGLYVLGQNVGARPWQRG